MSADEIRRITDLSTPIIPEHWQATVMWPEQWDKIKAALLAYAAIVERCDNARRMIAKHNKVFREIWGNDDVFDGNNIIDYILKSEVKDGK